MCIRDRIRHERSGYVLRNLILNCEEVFELLVECARPDLGAIARAYKLNGNSQPVAFTLVTSFEHGVHTERMRRSQGILLWVVEPQDSACRAHTDLVQSPQ